LLVLRDIPRLWRPALFAEDGQIFLAQAHNCGLAAFLKPYAGYLHFIPRLVAALLAPFPVTAAPVLYAVAALVLHLAMLTPALSARLEWIIPGQMLRAVLFTLLCLMLPLREVLGNVTNLIWIIGVSLLLLMLSDDPRTRVGSVCELVVLTAFSFSGLMITFYAPFFAWRWRRTRSRHGLALFVMAIGGALAQGAMVLLSNRQTPGGSLIYVPRVWVKRVGGTWLFGDSAVFNSPWRSLLLMMAFAWCVGALVITVVVLRHTAVLLWLLQFLLLAAPALAFGPMPEPYTFQRYFVVPIAIMIVLLVTVIGAGWWVKVAVVWLALGCGGMLIDFAPSSYHYRPDLTTLRQCVNRREPVCRQAIFDDGWWVELRQ
jgi:hypothetical protein